MIRHLFLIKAEDWRKRVLIHNDKTIILETPDPNTARGKRSKKVTGAAMITSVENKDHRRYYLTSLGLPCSVKYFLMSNRIATTSYLFSCRHHTFMQKYL